MVGAQMLAYSDSAIWAAGGAVSGSRASVCAICAASSASAAGSGRFAWCDRRRHSGEVVNAVRRLYEQGADDHRLLAVCGALVSLAEGWAGRNGVSLLKEDCEGS